MVCIGGRALGSHFEDLEDHCVDSGVEVPPDVVEYAKRVDVQDTFNRELSEKCMAGIGEDLLSLRNPLSIFLWKISSDFIEDGQMGRAGRQERSEGKLQVLQRCTFRTGDRRHP